VLDCGDDDTLHIYGTKPRPGGVLSCPLHRAKALSLSPEAAARESTLGERYLKRENVCIRAKKTAERVRQAGKTAIDFWL